MSNLEIETLIYKINQEISKINPNEEYRLKEREILEQILEETHNFEISFSSKISVVDILISAIIINNEYECIEKILDVIDEIYTEINTISEEQISVMIKLIKEIANKGELKQLKELSNSELKKFLNQELGSEISKQYKIFKLLYISNIDLIEQIPQIIKIKNIKEEFIENFDEINEKYEYISDKKIGKVRNKVFREYLEELFGIKQLENNLSIINKFFVDTTQKNQKNKINKNKYIKRLNDLKEFLLNSEKQEQITDIQKIEKLVGDSPIYKDVLIFIYNKNQKYYDILETEYNKSKENSLENYITFLNKNNINFDELNEKIQEKLLKIELKQLKEYFEYMEDIKYPITKTNIKYIIETNTKILEKLKGFINKGIINTQFLISYPNVMLNELNEESLYTTFLLNLDLLSKKGINILNFETKNMNIFVCNYLLLIQNINILEQEEIQILNKGIKNYSFIIDKDLGLKIKGLKDLGIDINKNFEVLYSDINIIKRIRICLDNNINIYDNDKIRIEILNKDEFFISDENLDEYISDSKKVKN